MNRPSVGEAGTDEARTTLGLKELLRGLPQDRKHSVLDLGPASSGNVHFFSGYSCRLYIADLFRTLRQGGGLPPEQSLALDRELAATLPEGCYDLILCWDLLNYLSSSQMEVLGRHLAERSRPGSRLFALIAPHGEIPELPRRFEILSADAVRYTDRSEGRRPAPGYREPELNRWMSPFAVESSYLLRHGIQEYILVHRGARGGAERSSLGRS
jgi:hypothetical protein